jgi:hypothetical protein
MAQRFGVMRVRGDMLLIGCATRETMRAPTLSTIRSAAGAYPLPSLSQPTSVGVPHRIRLMNYHEVGRRPFKPQTAHSCTRGRPWVRTASGEARHCAREKIQELVRGSSSRIAQGKGEIIRNRNSHSGPSSLGCLKAQATKRCPIGRSSDSQVCAPPSSNGWTGQRSILIFDSDLIEVKATKQKPPHVGEVPLTREFETTITAIETKNDRSLES